MPEDSTVREDVTKEIKMWLITAFFIAPIACFGSHLDYCIIAWLSFPSTAAAVLIMYSLTFIFYFTILKQLYIAIITLQAKRTKRLLQIIIFTNSFLPTSRKEMLIKKRETHSFMKPLL